MKQIERDELLIRLDERTKNTNIKVAEMHLKIYGNGKDGLCDIVQQNKTTLKNTKTTVIIGLSFVTIVCTIIALIF